MIGFESTLVLPLTMIFHLVLLAFSPPLTSMAKGNSPCQHGFFPFLAYVGATVHPFLILAVMTAVLALRHPSIFPCDISSCPLCSASLSSSHLMI